jgi:hypothetical protein
LFVIVWKLLKEIFAKPTHATVHHSKERERESRGKEGEEMREEYI